MLQGSIDSENRRSQLGEILRSKGAVILGEVSSKLGVSEMTIRRDLKEMEHNGMARRVRGGAVAVGPELFQRRINTAAGAKKEIAKKLSSLLPDSGAVGFDASSTIYQLAHKLEPRDISILCTGIETASLLSRSRKVSVSISGGTIEETTGALVGPLAIASIEQYVFTRSFVSPTCISPEFGVMEATVAGAQIKMALREASKSLVVAIDSTKLGESAMARALQLEEIDILVTELNPHDHALDDFRERVEIL